MDESKSILHELYVFSEWKPEPEYIQKPDGILPENISALWRWVNFFGPKKSLIDSITAHKEHQQKWRIALGDEGKVIAVLTDNILEIRTKRSDYATIAARTTVSRDAYPQWRKLVWSPDCSFVVIAYGNGVVSFFDLTASNLFNIPIDCSRPGGLECTDNTHAVVDIIFMPLRVKNNKWNWEVLVVTYDGKLRGYLVSQTDGFKLYHSFRFPGGVGAVAYCNTHSTLYVAGVPRGIGKDPSSPLSAGITAWRILNDDPFYKLSVVSDQLEAQLANERFHLYIPFVSSKHLAFVVQMVISPDGSKLVCLHCNGDISIWRLPLLKLVQRWPLAAQPLHALRSPLRADDQPGNNYHVADVNWWTNEEIIMSRFSGAVSVCNVEDMINILGKKPEFFQGSPQVTCAHEGTFMALECESNVLPAKKSRSDESMEVVKVEYDTEDSMLELTKELFKSILYAITDIETFQPKPKRITVVSRVYRLLGVKSTTPTELFSRKIESGNYTEALTLAETFNLDSDLVYQQQWRKNPVSTDAIQKYLSKVSKKIWAVHQCVDRLPETLPAAKELLQFGLELTNERILDEINKDLSEDLSKDPDDITLEDLNAYTSELLRCRHVMLFYTERLQLYEAILKCEKSTYVKDEYDRLRSNSIVHSSMEIAKEGRIEALTCLWPHIETVTMQLAVLEKLPETINPIEYQHLLPTKHPVQWFEKKSPIKIPPSEHVHDWCRKEIFRSIWSSNWSEDTTPEFETAADQITYIIVDIPKWYDKRAREIEEHSGLVSHALTLITIATVGGGVGSLDHIMFHLLTLDTLIYDINVEGVTLKELQNMSILETCSMLMGMSTPATFVSDLKQFVIPFLKRFENLSKRTDTCLNGLTEYLESISVDDLSPILLVLQSPSEFELDVRTHLELAEKCLYAHTGTDQLDKACDLLDTILKESDGSISSSELVRRVKELERVVAGSTRLAWRGVRVPPAALRDLRYSHHQVLNLLTRLARSRPISDEKPTQQDWEILLKDILELQATLFECISKEQCYEIYALALLTSGDASSIRLAPEVLTCEEGARRGNHLVDYEKSIELSSCAAKEYFNSASSLTDPALELAKCCLTLIKDDKQEIQEELDLIAALQLLSAFKLSILPIQVRLCENRITLIEQCLKIDPNAYLASHKLLKLAKLLRIAGDDENTREGVVLQLVGEYAVSAGPGGGGAAAEAGARLAALRHAPAAALLAQVAGSARAHAGPPARRRLLAAALAACDSARIEDMLRARLALELESLQQMGVTLKETSHLTDRWPSTDDEFADAITTPVIEKKDLVAPAQPEKKIPLFNYLLDTFQNKFTISDNKSASQDSTESSVHCQEFYHSLYPEHGVSQSHYRYDRFSIPDAMEGQAPVGQAVLKWFYIQNCLENGATSELETEVVQKCAEEMVYKDTALSVSCLLRVCSGAGGEGGEGGEGGAWPGGEGGAWPGGAWPGGRARVPLAAALYAALIKCNAPDLRDNVYLTKPTALARTTLKHKNASEEQLEMIRQCIDKLTGMSEVESLRKLGFSINGLLFNADDDYRREVIYRVARSTEKKHVETACSLARKYGVDALDVWLQHATAAISVAQLSMDTLPTDDPLAHTRLKEALWPQIPGDDHNALISYFTLLRSVDEKPLIFGLSVADHIKLLKKAKAASSELDYKLLLEQPTADQLSSHMVQIMKPENVGMVTKFLRTLPPLLKPPLSVNCVYTKWLTKYFFSVPAASATNKKWMQQYRQCASYFNKLGKEDLLQFVADTCFTDDAIERVPAGTRNLMIMQAVDYCQQEQENDFKINKNEQTWSQVGQELSRWARFLENFHSTTIQGLIDNTNLPRGEIWSDIEKSHGDTDKIVTSVGRVVMVGDVRAATLGTLLQCLHANADAPAVFNHIVEHHVHNAEDTQTLVSRLTQYHKEGVKFPEDLLDKVMEKASEYSLPPHKQIGLLSLSQKSRVHDTDDMLKIAQFSIDLFRTEWSDSQYAMELTDNKLADEAGRREAFTKFLELSNTWQKKKALVDVLNCWPPTGSASGDRSLHCEYLHSLLNTTDQKESLVLIKLLLRRPVLTEEDIKWIAENVHEDAVINTIWIILLSKCDSSKGIIINLLVQYKDSIKNQEIEEDLIKELLDNEMFIKLVPTPLYSFIINYIISRESTGELSNIYSVHWATNELLKANYLAEAGHLRLTAVGIPAALRGFSQSVLYCKDMFNRF